jgi:hypothetical protein
MATQNLISLNIPEEQLTQIQAHVTGLTTILSPHLKTLSGREIQGLHKMGDNSIPFVEKSLEYARTNPEFLPPYIDVDEFKIDFQGAKILSSIYKPLAQLIKALLTSMILCGSEAYGVALAYYNSVKQAAKMNVAGAQFIYEDLKKRFEQQSGSDDSDAPVTPGN